MELELQHMSLDGFRLLLDRSLILEETMEGIVPDICPDMTRIVDTNGQVFLTARELSVGSLRIMGLVRTVVLYIPEGGNGPRQIRFDLPFSCTVDDPGLHGGCKVWAMPRLAEIEARAINPRKVLIRGEIVTDLLVYTPEEQRVCSSATCDVEIGLQQRRENHEIYVISAVNEKEITFSDVFSIPASRPNAAEILCSRVEQRGLEAKVIGGKLVAKGETELIVLYRTQEDSAALARFALPYSQVMELSGVSEESEVMARAVVTGLECTLQQGDSSAISVTVEMRIHGAAFEKRRITLLDDLYATSCQVEPERESISVCMSVQHENRRENVRQFCECGIPAKLVVDTSLAMKRVTAEKGTEGVTCKADTAVTVLFLSEDDALCSVTYPIFVEMTAQDAFGEPSGWRCRGLGELSAVPVTGGLEVRFGVEFYRIAMEEGRHNFVGGGRILPIPEGGRERPSVILRSVGAGESLWDIAKAYQSTAEDITAANELDGEQITEGTMLLIPRRR